MAIHPIDNGNGAATGYWTADDLPGDENSGGSAGGDDAAEPGRNGLADYTLTVAADDAATLRYYAGLGHPLSIAIPSATSPGGGGDSSFGAAFSAPSATLVDDFGGASAALSGPPGVDSSAKGNARPGGGHGGGGGGSGSGYPKTVTYSNASNLVFNITYDSSVGTAPSGFVTGFVSAIDYFLANFDNSMTINLDVGWGEVAGQRLSAGALGESSTNIFQVSYSSLQGKMPASLPAGDPISGTHFYWVASAEEKALGLTGATGSGLDGAVGFSSGVSWNFGGGSGYDFASVAEHEISETMGRIALLGATISGGGVNYANGYTPMDLFRYSGFNATTNTGTRSLVGGQAAYFSTDNGQTPTLYFNTQAGGDWGDWQSSGTHSAGNDAYNAFASSGVLYAPSATDKTLMNVLGYGSPTA
jgi:hypothetical protein